MPQRVSSPHWPRHLHLEVGLVVIANEVVVELGHIEMFCHQKALIDSVDVRKRLQASRGPPVNILREVYFSTKKLVKYSESTK